MRAAVLFSRFAIADGCWEWLGRCDRRGYATYGRAPAHRVVYQLLVASIPDGMHLDHVCRNRACVNPSHMKPVTPAENNRRKEAALGIGQFASHCVNGHAFSPENTYLVPNLGYQHRDCRVCVRERVARYKLRKAAA